MTTNVFENLAGMLPLICRCGNKDHGRLGAECSAECQEPPRRMILDVEVLVRWAYRQGWNRAVDDFATWHDGEQLVGALERPKNEVLTRGPHETALLVDLHVTGDNYPGRDPMANSRNVKKALDDTVGVGETVVVVLKKAKGKPRGET